MAGVDLQPQRGREARAFRQTGQFRVAGGVVPLGVEVAIGAGVQFDHGRADAGGGLDLAGVVADEQRHAAACLAQGGDELGQALLVARDVEAALGRPLFALFGNDADGVGTVAQGDGLHLGRRGHFQVQGDVQPVGQARDVGVRDMAAVFPQMGGDAVGTGLLRQKGGAQGIGPGGAARVPHGGHMVDVDAQSQHDGFSPWFPRPSLAARAPRG